MGTAWGQSLPPSPSFTSESVSNLFGKVFIVTGSTSGIGFELAKILYQHNGTVYVAARFGEKASVATRLITTTFPDSKGNIHFLQLDLADSRGIKKSAEEFVAREGRPDVLWNNARVLTPPVGANTVQGHELQLGTNCIGPFLFTRMLLPLLKQTAASASAPRDSTINPGNLISPLQRNVPAWERFLVRLLAYKPIYGAYTELFAGLSPEINKSQNGCYIASWGRVTKVRSDFVPEFRDETDGRAGKAKQF